MVNEPHQCDHCDRAFGSAHEKKRHMELAHREEIGMNDEYACSECGATFLTERGLQVHTGRKHSKHAHKPEATHPWRSPAVMPDTAPEQKVNPGEEPIPDEGSITLADLARDGIGFHLAVDYRMELIETLAELAMWEATLADPDAVQATLARIKAVARHE